MPDFPIAVVLIDPPIEEKLRTKHSPLTAETVRQALIYARDVDAGWEDDPEHGRRLVAHASTYGGIEFVAYLIPANEGDPEEGTFILKTAIPKANT